MTPAMQRTIYWLPRLLGVLFAAFLSLFALDVLLDPQESSDTAAALAMHLIPAAAMLVIVAIASRYERLGALLLAGAGVWYALATRQHPSWVLVIAAPLLGLAALFAVSARLLATSTARRGKVRGRRAR